MTVEAPPVAEFALSDQQITFFNTFGFLKIPGLFRDDFSRLERGFEQAFGSEDEPTVLDPRNPYHESRDPAYANLVRSMVPYFLERSDDLVWLKSDPRVVGLVTSLIGPRYEYAESDGNRFNCDVKWHIDAYGSPIEQFHIKLYFYLDPLEGSTGALRVIPGSNHYTETYAQTLYRELMGDPTRCEDLFGVSLEEIPSWTLDVQPGDLLVGNYRTLHGSFNGGVGRRLFTVNFKEPAAS